MRYADMNFIAEPGSKAEEKGMAAEERKSPEMVETNFDKSPRPSVHSRKSPEARAHAKMAASAVASGS